MSNVAAPRCFASELSPTALLTTAYNPLPDCTEQTTFGVLSACQKCNSDVANPDRINRLPTELLCVVFEHLRQRRCTEHRDAFDSYVPLASAMQVCRKWYCIAHEHAALWTDVTLELTAMRGLSPRWDAHLLERSKAALIELRLEFSSANITQCETVLTHHGSRVRRLELFTPCVVSVHELPRMLRALASPSSLTHLTLSLPNPMEMGTPQIRADPGPMPLLQALFLDRVLWMPPHPLFALTEVHLMGIQPLPLYQLSTLSILGPNLETLRFTACTLDRCHPPASPSPTFPQLRTLAFARTPASVVQELTSWLVLPIVENIQVESCR